jgi:hypothetical protein
MTDTDDIEVLYKRFEDLLIRCFAAAYSGAAWDLPSQRRCTLGRRLRAA